MNNSANRPEIPASYLENLAVRLSAETTPIKIQTSADQVALASEALWLFAKRTGLDQEGETLETVLTDFLANVLHLAVIPGSLRTKKITSPQYCNWQKCTMNLKMIATVN